MFSASEPLTTPNTKLSGSIKTGGFGLSKSALNGDTSPYAAKLLPRVYARLVNYQLDSTSGPQNATHHLEVTYFGLRVEDLQASAPPHVPRSFSERANITAPLGLSAGKALHGTSLPERHCCECPWRLRYRCGQARDY